MKSNVLVFSGSDLLTCRLPAFCPPMLWVISLEFCGKPFILEADDFLGACSRKAVAPQKLWTLLFRDFNYLIHETYAEIWKENKKGPTSSGESRVNNGIQFCSLLCFGTLKGGYFDQGLFWEFSYRGSWFLETPSKTKKRRVYQMVSAECRVPTKETKHNQGYWAQQYIWHLERHSQERRTMPYISAKTPF